MNYLTMIIAFATGGGLFKLVTWGLSKRTAKLEFTDKYVKFVDEQADSLMKRVETLEIQVNALSRIQCGRLDCLIRINTCGSPLLPLTPTPAAS